MIDMESFRKEDGNIDWTAYEQARRDVGELCYKCGAYILFNSGSGPRTCASCNILSTRSTSVSHERFIRCPKCMTEFDPGEAEMWEVYEAGEHEIYCPECDQQFIIETNVKYSFESPELCEEEDDT